MLPPFDYPAPMVNPSMTGLYAVATLIPAASPASRLSGGVIIHPVNCGGNAGLWPADPCAPTGDASKHGERPLPSAAFVPVTVWGWDQCDLAEPEDALLSRAEQALTLSEQGMVESALAVRLAADGAPLGTATDIVDAVGKLELALADAGIVGVIHANARVAAIAEDKGMIIRTGSALRTPLGHLWAFGAGYDFGVLHATGTPTVWRDAITARTSIAPFENLRVAVAERTILAGYECHIAAVTVADQEV